MEKNNNKFLGIARSDFEAFKVTRMNAKSVTLTWEQSTIYASRKVFNTVMENEDIPLFLQQRGNMEYTWLCIPSYMG
jgi:hypothetical protein